MNKPYFIINLKGKKMQTFLQAQRIAFFNEDKTVNSTQHSFKKNKNKNNKKRKSKYNQRTVIGSELVEEASRGAAMANQRRRRSTAAAAFTTAFQTTSCREVGDRHLTKPVGPLQHSSGASGSGRLVIRRRSHLTGGLGGRVTGKVLVRHDMVRSEGGEFTVS